MEIHFNILLFMFIIVNFHFEFNSGMDRGPSSGCFSRLRSKRVNISQSDKELITKQENLLRGAKFYLENYRRNDEEIKKIMERYSKLSLSPRELFKKQILLKNFSQNRQLYENWFAESEERRALFRAYFNREPTNNGSRASSSDHH